MSTHFVREAPRLLRIISKLMFIFRKNIFKKTFLKLWQEIFVGSELIFACEHFWSEKMEFDPADSLLLSLSSSFSSRERVTSASVKHDSPEHCFDEFYGPHRKYGVSRVLRSLQMVSKLSALRNIEEEPYVFKILFPAHCPRIDLLPYPLTCHTCWIRWRVAVLAGTPWNTKAKATVCTLHLSPWYWISGNRWDWRRDTGLTITHSRWEKLEERDQR